MKRILVTGSREWTCYKRMRRALLDHGPGIIVHGACRGADVMADQIAKELGWPREPHPAAWGQNPRAGFDRNQDMVDLGADVCLAFPTARSSGTHDCAIRARLADIPVVYFEEVRGG